jgi:probable phosphoglycerate mutase
MTDFLLVRHAACDPVGVAIAGRAPGVSLNEQGRLEAERVADRLAGTSIIAVYSSPLERARETAQAISQRHDLAVHDHDAFAEIDFGDWTGRTLESLAPDEQWHRFNTLRSATRIPGGELVAEAQLRAVRGLEALRCAHPSGVVVIVTHADIIRATLAFYLGMPIDLMLRLEISPASVSAIRLDEWGLQVTCVNHAAGAAAA